MAAEWDFEFIPIDVALREAKVVGKRTDGEDVRTYTLDSVTLKTQAQQLQALDRIWEMHVKALALETATTAFLANLATQAKQNMEAREP